MNGPRAALVGAAVTLTAAACGVLPSPPPPLQTDFVPQASAPSATVSGTADGFSAEEHVSVRVRVTKCDGWATGSGWVLSENQVITNRHVVADGTEIEVTTYDGRDYVVATAQIAPVADLALLTLDPVFTEWAPWESREPGMQEQLSIVGYPEGQQLTTTPAVYVGDTADTVESTGEAVQGLRAVVKHGNSGSPLFDASGTVVGTVYAGDEVGGGLAWSNTYLDDLLTGATQWQPLTPGC